VPDSDAELREALALSRKAQVEQDRQGGGVYISRTKTACQVKDVLDGAVDGIRHFSIPSDLISLSHGGE
jgi:hypothetical protein